MEGLRPCDPFVSEGETRGKEGEKSGERPHVSGGGWDHIEESRGRQRVEESNIVETESLGYAIRKTFP